MRVLVVDDEDTLAELLSMAFRHEGWEVQVAHDGPGALRAARDFRPDVTVLDVMMPGYDGLEVLRRMRGASITAPVLFLSARDAVKDRVAGLTAGGDDYVTKPFSLEEVVARVGGMLRRVAAGAEGIDSVIRVGDLALDGDSREVSRGDQSIDLTATEFELLRCLMQNQRRVMSKAELLDRVWNYDFGGQTNVVDQYISYLRRKIDAGRSPMIHTVRAVGYVIKPAE
ncbi:MAG: response regulator transcription factor [Nocardioides sp.]|uniref:response regulator transcription factor n=1 Tax=Nocardioides sp. TaxID=35761 RepID=UPI0039E545C6